MHPSAEIEREYAVRLRGRVPDRILTQLQKGVVLEDGVAKFDRIKEAGGTGTNHWYHVIVTEGRNRLVRRVWEAMGFTVSRLMRIRFGPITLPQGLNRGQFCELSSEQIALLERLSKK
jgi:23S rRNA pseudouridine2605 synthase